MSGPVHHQPSLAEDVFALWRLPFELGVEWAAATAQLLADGWAHAHPSAQLPVPEPLAEHDEHGLFA